MFKAKNKTIIIGAVFISFLLLLSFLVPLLQNILSGAFRQPLDLLALARRQAGALIFYQRNFVRNERLEKESALLRQKINSLEEDRLENIRLQRILAFKQKADFRVLAARVIGRSADSWSSVIIINKGSNSGIRRGMAVITYLGLLGRVSEAASSSAKVMLINDPHITVSAMVQRSRQEGAVSGTLGNHLIMRYLSEDADIKIGDVIITSGLDTIYPKGTLIGKVVAIGKEFSGLSHYAVINPALDLSGVEEALIIIP
ncbi:MAG: rod shape-determining protein MreC [Candidatus Omnitrophica bacterium]|nr:rod shape-determining protein MreC [Candidatus Omnitrophota bacterium]